MDTCLLIFSSAIINFLVSLVNECMPPWRRAGMRWMFLKIPDSNLYKTDSSLTANMPLNLETLATSKKCSPCIVKYSTFVALHVSSVWLSVNLLLCSTYTDNFAVNRTEISPWLAIAMNSSFCISNDVAALPPLVGKVWSNSKHLGRAASEDYLASGNTYTNMYSNIKLFWVCYERR